MAEILGAEIADYGLTGRTSFALMGQLLSKTQMAEMLGVEIADYGANDLVRALMTGTYLLKNRASTQAHTS